jgi:hypothetical protein
MNIEAVSNLSYKETASVLERAKELELTNQNVRRSQWPRGLRHDTSSLTRTLGSWVRIYVCVYFVSCIVLCVGSGLTMG